MMSNKNTLRRPNGSDRWGRWLLMLIMSVSAGLLQSPAHASIPAAPNTPRAPHIDPNDPTLFYVFQPVATTGINTPVFVTNAGNGDARLFIVEQGGLIKIVRNGQILDTPFINIGTSIACCGERGLLGMAFEPDYAQTGRFYLYYNNKDGDIIIARYTVSANPNVANPGGQILLTVSHPDASNHNGGWVGFGPDQFLYVGVGDGGGGGNDPGGSTNRCSAQNVANPTGKILRLNVVGETSYTSPITNAFANGQAPEVWAIGVRNPWRNSFDRQTGEFYIADVGQGAFEEVSVLPAGQAAGANLGWPLREGRNDYPNEASCSDSGRARTEPFVDYSHGQGTSITGGYVYRGQHYPVITGVYFYGDFGSGRLWAAWRSTPSADLQTAEIKDTDFSISAFGEGADGELYLVNYGNANTAAGVYRLEVLSGLSQRFYLPLMRR